MPWRRRGGVPATAASAPDPHRRRGGGLPVLGRGGSVGSIGSIGSIRPPPLPAPCPPTRVRPAGSPPLPGLQREGGGGVRRGGVGVCGGGKRERGQAGTGTPPHPRPFPPSPPPPSGRAPRRLSTTDSARPPALRRGRCGPGPVPVPAVGHASVAMTVDCYCPVPTQQ